MPEGLGSKSTLENNASIVFRLEYGNHSFLFMGDGEGKERDDAPDTAQFIERILLDTVPQLKSTVLKIAHHGSETSSTLPFIQAAARDGGRLFRAEEIQKQVPAGCFNAEALLLP